MQLNKALNAIRLVKRVPQTAIAERAGMTKDWYSRLETGKSQPTLPTLRAIASGLGVPLWQLFWLCDREPGGQVPEDYRQMVEAFPELRQYLEQSASLEHRLPHIPLQLNLFEE